MTRILALEGPDCSGKSVLATAIAAGLRARGSRVVVLSDPGTTPLGLRLRPILLDPDLPVDETELTLLFAAGSHSIRRAIAASDAEVAILDRCYLSDLAYRAAGSGGEAAAALALRIAVEVGNVIPPGNILCLQVPHAVLDRRLAVKRGDRFELRGADFQQRVRQAYGRLVDERRCVPVPLETDDLTTNVRLVLDRWNAG